MSIRDYANKMLKYIPNPEPKKFILALLELGEITPYNGKYSKLVDLTREYDCNYCNGMFEADEFFRYYPSAERILQTVGYMLEDKGSAVDKLDAIKSLLNSLDLKAEVFKDEDILEPATAGDLDDLRENIIEEVIACESVGYDDETD